MYEVILLSLAYIPVGIAKRFFTKDGSFLDNLVGGIGEGLIGEAAEETLESVFGYFSNRNKRATVLADCVRNMCLEVKDGFDDGTYSVSDFEAFSDFLNKLNKSEALQKKINKLKTSKKINEEYSTFKNGYSVAVNAVSSAFKCKDRKDRNKAIEKIFKDYAKHMEKYIDSQLAYKDRYELAEQWLGAENAKDVPKLVDVMLKHMYFCVYEMKFTTLADDDRDVVKLMQQITVETYSSSTEKIGDQLIKKLDNYLHLILQQNTYLSKHQAPEDEDYSDVEAEIGGDVSLARKRLAKLAKTDNLVWIEHVCPKCGARGDNVDRIANNIECRICGSKCSIFDEPSNEVKEMLKEVGLISSNTYYLAEDIKKAVGEVNGSVKNIDNAVKQLIMSDAEIVESIISLKNDSKDQANKIEDLVKDRFASLEDAFNKTGEGINGIIDKLASQYNTIRQIESGIEELKKKQDEATEELRKSNRDMIMFIGGCRGPVSPRLVKIEKRRCAICGRNDSDWSGNVHNVCGIPSDESDKVWDISIEYDPRFRQYEFIPKEYIEGATVGKVKITGSNANFVDSDMDELDEETFPRLKKLRTLIVSSVNSIETNETLVKYLLGSNRASNVTKIILSENVRFVCGNSRLGWSYDAKQGVLTKL